MTPLIVAAGANSPLVFQHQLWHESRIPLFKQSIDCRRYDPRHPIPARVNFGHAWVRESVLEIFTEAVRLYQPLLPITSKENPMQSLKNGASPLLEELRLQQGSVWLWNRPVYDPSGDGHIRIEARCLPAGPSVIDMVANTALTLGLMEVMRPRVRALLSAMPFEYCERNFYRAADEGLTADIIWPSSNQNRPEYRSCREVLLELPPEMLGALEHLGIDKSDSQPLVSLLEERIQSGQTGAQWQLQSYESLKKNASNDEALRSLLLEYRKNSGSNLPVSQWPVP